MKSAKSEVDFTIFGMGLPSAYLASRLSAEGFSIGLFGDRPQMVPEPVPEGTVKELGVEDFCLNKLNFITHFDENFRLEERPFEGFIVDVPRLYRHYLVRAMNYGCEILQGCEFSLEPETRIIWAGKTHRIDPGKIVLEQGGGGRVPAVMVGRIPFNKDTVEVYKDPDMWIIPSGDFALAGGTIDFAWHKFEHAAVLRKYELPLSRPYGDLVDEKIRIGRAAGHTSREGFVMESSLLHVRLLSEILMKGENPEIYENVAKKSSLRSWLRNPKQ